MIVSSVTSTPSDYLTTQRTTNDLVAINAQIAQDAQTNPADTTALDASASETVDAAAVRATLEQRIAQDVASGTLSDSDATTVRLTLDEIDGGAAADQTNTTTSTQQNNNTNAVQAGDNTSVNGTQARTVLTQTVTIEGGVTTTVTFYSDGTQEKTTSVATPDDIQRYGDQTQIEQQNAAQTAAQATATQYLATIEAGTLFNQLA